MGGRARERFTSADPRYYFRIDQSVDM